jgi:hypothetical protein
MILLEDVAGLPERDINGVGLAGLEHGRMFERVAETGAERALGDDDGLAVGVDVRESDEKVGIGDVGREGESGLGRAGHFEVGGEFGGGVVKDV